jgi:hypothetical protein
MTWDTTPANIISAADEAMEASRDVKKNYGSGAYRCRLDIDDYVAGDFLIGGGGHWPHKPRSPEYAAAYLSAIKTDPARAESYADEMNKEAAARWAEVLFKSGLSLWWVAGDAKRFAAEIENKTDAEIRELIQEIQFHSGSIVKKLVKQALADTLVDAEDESYEIRNMLADALRDHARTVAA